jgi:hypothetical protein
MNYLIESYQNSVCKINCGNDKGTGFLITNDLILTMKHVIAEAIIDNKTNINVSFLPNISEKHEAVLITYDDDIDIAIIKLQNQLNLEPLKLLKVPIFSEEKWYSFGFPDTENGSLVGESLEGTIKRYFTIHQLIIHDTDLNCVPFFPNGEYKGFSGSPVFDEKGNVFSILRRKLNKSLGAISINKLYSFLIKNSIPVETNYEKFDNKPFSRNWFTEHSEKILKNAGPRYTHFANVKLDYDKYFEAIARSNEFQNKLSVKFGEIKKKLYKFSFRNDNELNNLKINIHDVIKSLLNEIDKTLALTIDNQIDWNRISELSLDSYKKIENELYTLTELNKNKEIKEYQSNNKYDYEISQVRELVNSIYEVFDFSNSLEAKSSNLPFLLLKGKVGQGKTHLLCDIAINRIEKNEPTLMFFGQHFNNSEPWEQIISLLDLKCTKTEFLVKFNELGIKNNKKSLIFIDALNEGAGKDMWKTNIESFISDIKKYPWIGLVLSIRTPFEKVIIPKHLIEDNQILEINHTGFKGNEYKAIREYFKYYGIELFSVPLLDNEFSNPLFLKTFCEAFKKKGYYRLPKGAQKFSFVFSHFIEQKNFEISEKIDADPKLKILNKALNAFADTFVKQDLRSIKREIAHEICESIIDSRTWSKSLLFHMISEGVLFESMVFDEIEHDWVDTIDFAYERFSDFIKANFLLNYFKTEDLETPIIKNIFSEEKVWYYETLIQALSIVLPEQLNKEVYEYFPELKKNNIIYDAFFESLVWRSYNSLNDEKSSGYMDYLNKNNIDFTTTFLQVLLTVASDPQHIYNANYLHERLWSLSIADRDRAWTIPIFYWYKDSDKTIIDSYIDWAWSDDDKSHIDDNALLLSSIIISWFLTTSNRFLRDDATKALVNLLKDRPSILIQLLDKFQNVNDLYIAERLYAVAYGCVLISNNQDKIKIIAGKVYELVFADNNPPVHFLLRDYARNCIEKAIYYKIELNIDVAKVRPPYNSDWIEPITEEQAKKYEIEWQNDKNRSDEENAQSLLYRSIMGFEDFARYIIGKNSNITNWTLINLKQKQAYQNLKNSIKGKSKSLLKKYMDKIKHKYAFENVPDYKKKDLGEEIEIISEVVEITEKQLLENLTTDEKEILTTLVNPYFHSIFNKKNDRDNSFDLSIIQRFILQRVFEIGWTQEYFGKFDFYLNKYTDNRRETRKKERIGKKYQWLGLHEVLARLTDNFEYKVRFNKDSYNTCQGPWHDKFRRDIDPDILIREPQNSPLPQFVEAFDDNYELNTIISNKDWLKIDDDFPLIENLIEIIDQKGDKWLKLQGYFGLTENSTLDKDKYEQPRKDIWIHLQSYLVNKSKKKQFFNWAKEQDFMGRWMPEASDRYEYYLRESYWAPSYKYTKQPNYGYEQYFNPSFEKTNGKLSARIMVSTENYLKEIGSSIYDCSMDEGLSIVLPCEYIVNKMGLSFGKREGYLYDNENNLIAFDPSVWDNAKSGLLINKDAFIKFLNENNLDIVFTILGEKRVIGNPFNSTSLEISGAYILNDKNEIEGKYTSSKNK